jgi:hypothetical protein
MVQIFLLCCAAATTAAAATRWSLANVRQPNARSRDIHGVVSRLSGEWDTQVHRWQALCRC